MPWGKLAMILLETGKQLPIIAGIIKSIKDLFQGKGDGEKKDIDKIQNELMEKLAEQQIKYVEALSSVHKYITIITLISISSIIISVVALIVVIIK